MRIAVVSQRYGADISGGAELHARYIAERLAKHVHVEVLTTCATDYVTWRNSLPGGVESVHGITVRRFPTSRERDPDDFAKWSERVFEHKHSLRDELCWLDAEGPTSPELISYIRAHAATFDFLIFFSFRYYHSFHGARAVAGKAILVPTAERDGALGLAMFGPIFRGVRALMYNSFEERALIQGVSQNGDVPGVVVGVGSEIPEQTSAARFRRKFDFRDRFAIYVGRIDENKGCAELFDFFQRYSGAMAEGMHLVLIGNPIIAIPDHPRIHHLGFVSDQDKFDALSAAELLIMPSYLESLSMVALEAWALGKPVLANGKCDVLRGQCVRSNGGLYYESFDEFIETLKAIDMGPVLASSLGRNGRDYFNKHYTWPVIERKYLDILERLKREPAKNTMEPLAGWFAQRRKNLPAANEVVAALPTGPAHVEQRPTTAAEPAMAAPERSERAPSRPRRPESRFEPRGPRAERPERERRDRERPPRRERTERTERTDQRQPFDSAQGKPFDSAQGKPLSAQGKSQRPRQQQQRTERAAGTPARPTGGGRGPRRRRRGGGPPRKPH
jgi:glycosyltransferase involved in cell wall biosynthesis